MKKQVLITMTLVGMTLAACSKKDSYRAGKFDGGSNGGLNGDSQTEASISAEQKALDTLEKDVSFMSVHDNQPSEDLKDSIKGIEVKQMVQETENTDISVTQFTILDKNSKECSPIQFNTQGYTQEALLKGVKIKGNYRLQCIDSECNDLLFFKEQFRADNFSPVPVETILQGSAVVRLSKDENGVYKPVQSESEMFAKAQSIDEAIQKCLTDKAAISGHSTNSETRKESEASVDSDTRRLYQISKDIGELQAQLKKSSNGLGRQTIQAEIDSLNAERTEIQKRIQQNRKDEAKARDLEARKEYSITRSHSENLVRLTQIDRQIKDIDSKIAALAPQRATNGERQELKARRAKLMEERVFVVQNIQSSNSKLEMVDPTGDQSGPR